MIPIADRLRNAARSIKGASQPIFLEYEVNPNPRFGHGKAPQSIFLDMFKKGEAAFEQITDALFDLEALFCDIAAARDGEFPRFRNGWMPALDALLLCHFAATRVPQTYLEVGSGNSTAFVKKCVTANQLRTKIVSIDPQPRREIDAMCDTVIRSRLENANLDVFTELQSGDIVFVDNSHRSFTNSDCTVFMTEVLHVLKPGVLVGLHDIFLPDDYLPMHASRYYSEQYLLACYLLGGFNGLNIVFPTWHQYYYGSAAKRLGPLYKKLGLLDGGEESRHGCSFWFETTAVRP